MSEQDIILNNLTQSLEILFEVLRITPELPDDPDAEHIITPVIQM